jgi:ribosomal protein S18 acetylase RimI-like enzyme
MYVEHRMNRSGIGSVLMRACLAQAVVQGEKLVWLRVWEHNNAAIAFYEKWGFQKVGSIDFEMLGEMRTDWVMQFTGKDQI